MLIYKCIFTGDELFSSAYKVELVNGLYKITAKHVTRSERFDESKIGANASAEEENEVTDDSSISGIDVILDNRLTPTGFGGKKEYATYFKDFAKRLEERKKADKPDLDLAKWRADIQASFKYVLSNFDSYEFFTGESCNPDGSIGMVRWETPAGQTDDVPFVYFFAEGVLEEKC